MNKANKVRLAIINGIIEEYQAQGYVLTLRQLYYQLVSRDIIPNQQKEYNKLSILLKEGRMAGVVDWDAIEDRILEFADGDDEILGADFPFKIDKIALNMKQIKTYAPPPNPAKITDPRAKDFIARYGPHSWEVDALKPEVLNQILEDSIDKYFDRDLYDDVLKREKIDVKKLESLKKHL